MNAVAAVGLERARMHEALAAALIKDEADRAIFDESFNRFFAAPRANRGEHPDHRADAVSAAGGRGRPGENPFALPRDDALARDREEKSLPSEAKPAKQAAAARRHDAERGDLELGSELRPGGGVDALRGHLLLDLGNPSAVSHRHTVCLFKVRRRIAPPLFQPCQRSGSLRRRLLLEVAV